jgi:capsular polysaccharide biosynthesis protein
MVKGMNREWKIYIEALKNSLLIVGVISLAAGILTAAMLNAWGPSFEMHWSYVVSLEEREEVGQEYTFDGYYALQATDLFVASLAKWIITPETVVASYQAAGLKVPTKSARSLARIVKADKTAPQIVQVVVSGKNPEEVRRLAMGVQQVMTQNVARYHSDGIPKLEFRVITTDEWLGQQDIASEIAGLAVAGVVFFLLLNGVLLKESWKQMDV